MDIQLTSDEELESIAASSSSPSTQSATRWAQNRYSAWAEARNTASGPIDQVPEDFFVLCNMSFLSYRVLYTLKPGTCDV